MRNDEWLPSLWRRRRFASGGAPMADGLGVTWFEDAWWVTDRHACIVAPAGWKPSFGAVQFGSGCLAKEVALDHNVMAQSSLWDAVREVYPGALVYWGGDSFAFRCGDRLVAAVARYAGDFVPSKVAA